MSKPSKIARKLEDLARERNGSVVGDAILKVGFGALMTFVTFALVFGISAFFLSPLARMAGWSGWQIGLTVAGVFLVVASWSAWRNVDPLRGVGPLSSTDEAMMVVGVAAGLPMFSARHTTAGIAMILIGGPASIFEGLGYWASRLPLDADLLGDAAKLLAACDEGCPIATLRQPNAAQFLRRLGLVKIASGSLVLTDRGYKLSKKGETPTR